MRKWLWIAAMIPCIGLAQLRVATWNISNYGGGRVSDIQTVVFDSFQGRSMNPDIIVTQEILSAAAQNAFLNALNTAPSSSGTWSAAPFTDGNDTDNAFFYRSDRLSLVGSTVIATGGNSPKPPRDTKRYDVRLLGYTVLQPKLAIYSCHLKAGTAADDQSRRLAEATLVRNNAASLSGFDGFMVVGDFNTYTSTEDCYVKLTGSETNNGGRFFDPIASPGSWDGSSAFRYIHTQDPATSSGMNSRFDFLLLCQALVDGQGFEYAGNPALPYSSLTWNDQAHSYRAWGNDGSSFGNPLTVAGNAMVGATIAQSIRNAATASGGHVPVFLDLNVPAETSASPSAIDFGVVVQGTQITRSVLVSNSTNDTLWRSGIANLNYQLNAPSPFGAPSGPFGDPAGGSGNSHIVSLDTSSLGEFAGDLTINPTVPGGNAKVVTLSAKVVPDELYATTWMIAAGTLLSGTLNSLHDSDDAYAIFSGRLSQQNPGPPVEVVLETDSPVSALNSIAIRFESNCAVQLTQVLDAYDFSTGQWVNISSVVLGRGDRALTLNLSNPNRFVAPTTRKLRLRAKAIQNVLTQIGRPCTYQIDRVAWVLR